MRKRMWKYKLATIAKASGRSVHTVRDHCGKRFDPENFESVCGYVAAAVLAGRYCSAEVGESQTPVPEDRDSTPAPVHE